MRIVCLLLVLGSMVTPARGVDCPYQVCYCAGPDINCDDRYLTKVPQILFYNYSFLSSLNMDNNNITTIPTGSLPANLSSLSLQNNPIKTIGEATFDESIYTLQELYFSNALFTQIPEAVFHLRSLNILSISATNILEWNDTSMRQLGPTMKALTLDAVGLTTWPTWIKSMANLTELTVTGNSFVLIPDDDLDLLAGSLISLDLHNNSLSTLPQSLARMTVLNKLSLDHNRITEVNYLPQLTHIQILSLDNNKITDAESLSSALKPFADSLRTFSINDNLLTSFPELSFMSQLTDLDFTFNRISDISTGSVPSIITELKMDNNFLPFIPRMMSSLTNIYTLYLNSNTIRIIQGAEFPPSVLSVHLESNLITQLTRTSFPNNSKINFINLNNNPIFSISPDAFNNLLSLTELYLQKSELNRLPLAISPLIYLENLDVSGSPYLVCTCGEQNLQQIIQGIGPFNAQGDCGLTSVYFFFSNLSPHCPPLL